MSGDELCPACAAKEIEQASACHKTTRSKPGAPCTCPLPKCNHERTTMTKPENEWIEDHGELVTFASVLNDCGCFDGLADAVIEYLEKPWKWSTEHAVWIDLGRRLSGDLTDDDKAAILDAGFGIADTERPADCASNIQDLPK